MKTLAFCCFAWVGVVLSASPANALMFSTQSDTSVQVSAHFVQSLGTVCDGTIQTFYLQRIKIAGHWMMVATDTIYSRGHRDLVLVRTCNDGTNIYEVCPPCTSVPSAAVSSYRELAQLGSPDRLSGNANTQLAEYRSPLRRDEPDGNPPAPSSALPSEGRRRYLPGFLVTVRG